ncbi:PrgI family mobile element protein, partial [Coprococcus comes]
MLSVAIHKDIAEYQPKVIGKLTGRTLISITVALGLSISVAVYMNLVLKIDPTDHLEFIYAVSLPCWCCGFWKP